MTLTDVAGDRARATARRSPWSALVGALRDWRPPISRREFWGVQLLVVLIAGGHLALEASIGQSEGALSYIPTSLFLVPVIYAALNFGLHGALPTALWSALITVPNLVIFHGDSDRLGELWQLGVVIAVAVFVGSRVDSEKRARHQAEDREQARRVSEEKYRGIFDHVVEPILVLNADCRVENANEAAARLFDKPIGQLTGHDICELIDIDLGGPKDGVHKARVLPVRAVGSRPQWIQPVIIPLADGPEQRPAIQLMLRDLTAAYERQQELEAYAQRTMQAREEERGTIARELHDGPVQSLVLLWRRLDEIEPPADKDKAAELRAAQRAVREAADELRRVSRNLRPSILDDLGLSSALRAEVAALRARTGLAARMVSTGSERRLGPQRELALLRIAQEALRNVEQHASAQTVMVRLRYEPASVRLSIADDGTGIVERTPAQLIAASNLGLIGMREQARLIDARLTIGSGRSGGTAVAVALDG